MKKSWLIIILILILIVITVAGVFSYITFFRPNEERTSLFRNDSINFIVEDKIILSDMKVIRENDEILLPLSLAHKYIDENINWDSKNKRLTVTTKDKVIRLKSNSLDAFINDEPFTLNIPVTVRNEEVYIPIEFLKDFYDIETMFAEGNNVFILDNKSEYNWIAEPIVDEVIIRTGRTIQDKVLGIIYLNADTSIRVFEEFEKWYKIRTSDGILGYVQKKDIKVKLEKKNDFQAIRPSGVFWKPEKGKINLVWELVASGRVNTSKIPDMEGVDIISPTWFKIQDTEGNIINKVDMKYLEWAHENEYQVWALVANDFQSPSNTGLFLQNSYARENFIKEIITYASLYELDGINIDFENINLENKEDYVQFLRELTPMLHEQGLVVSADVGIPDGSANWSLSHDREAISEIVDYVMIMTYDQHWSTSPKAGSVAQYSWVEDRIKRTLEEVPREKLLLGIPNYISVWREKSIDNGIKVSHAGYLSVRTAMEYIEKNDLELIWDDESGQYYAEFNDDEGKIRIWFEDKNSIDLKTSLVLKYNLAGTATWKRSDSNEEIWSVYNKNLKEYENYNQWQENYTRSSFNDMEEE